MTDRPRTYLEVPMPQWDIYKWQGTVADYCKITDPQFHGGNTVAIRLFDKTKDKPHPRGLVLLNELGKTDWIEFRNFKDANAYVQAVKRLSE